MNQRFDVLAFGAHPDDMEVSMGGTLAKRSDKGLTTLVIDLCDGEPTRHANRGAQARSPLLVSDPTAFAKVTFG